MLQSISLAPSSNYCLVVPTMLASHGDEASSLYPARSVSDPDTPAAVVDAQVQKSAPTPITLT